MNKKNLYYTFILFCLAIFQAMAQNLPEQSKIPIIAWHGIAEEKSSELFPAMKEAGIDIYLGRYKDVATTLKMLDIAKASGVKLITSCPELKSDVEATVKQLMYHPALYGYYLKDEPETWDLPELGIWVKQIQAIDKTNLCYINLYPNWAWGKEKYAANVQSFIGQVPVPFVSFDNYPIVEINKAPSILRPDWYRNLEEISDASKKAKLPFWAFALAWSHDLDSVHHYAVPTLAELRLQVFSDLAYGAQAIQYFTFYGAIDKNGKTPVYGLLQTINKEIENLSSVFLGATVISVWHTGSQIPDGTRSVGKLPEPIKSLSTRENGAIVSLLEKGDNQYLVIVNRDYRNTMALSIDVDPFVQRVLKNGMTTPAKKSSEQVEAGDMVIYTWKTPSVKAYNQETINIIPQPVSCTVQNGEFTITPKTKIVLASPQLQQSVDVLNDLFQMATGFKLPVTTGKAGNNTIYCTLNPRLGNDEAYQLSVKKNRINIEAKTLRGIFYATQTLRQLLPVQIESKHIVPDIQWTIPCVEIKDEPRFGYRGLHLDVCRHFMNKEEIKRYIDLLAYNKLNTFHWHLTDDQGWRIEIKQYPKLTKIGASRSREQIGIEANGKRRMEWVTKPHSGFYTQDDVREILDYAAKRFVTVIPEIEMPGHAKAALAAYPEYSCSGGPFEVEGRWDIMNDIYCTREETFSFIENILTEIAELFPSEYIHIGGDEAPKLRWTRCHVCQERMKNEGLKDENELQSYFITRIEKFLASKGKRIIGWDEILEGGLAPNATVMSWRGTEGGIAAAKQHHNVIMTPNTHMYLDYYQANPKTEPYGIGGYVPIRKVYDYEPIPQELTADESKYILGVQGNVWTEFISTFNHVLYMAYPRAAAVAEVGWSPSEKKNYENFKERVITQFNRYDYAGWNHSKAILTEEE